jgi:tRNA dimethylallyltransferase
LWVDCKISLFYPIFHILALLNLPMTEACNLIAVIGPTAGGKTSLAAHIASRMNGEIISADSRQVYRLMNLGTGKDYDDYLVNGVQIPHHLLDIAEPGYKYSVFEYQRDFFQAFKDIHGRGKMPVLCGGSGMYIDAAVKGYKLIDVPCNEELRESLQGKSLDELKRILASLKELHNITDTDSAERAIRAIEIARFRQINRDIANDLPPVHPVFIGILYERNTERARITDRLRTRMKLGMIEEVQQLLAAGIPAETLVYYGLEYKFITQYLSGVLTYEDMFTLLNTAIHQFAKRQRTWFRKMEKEGAVIHWLDGELPFDKKVEKAIRLVNEG